MKNKISNRIFIIFILNMSITLLIFLIYMFTIIVPSSKTASINDAKSASYSRSVEITHWIESKANEFRSLSQVPAFKTTDLRGISPIIENLTESYKQDGEYMEQFAYGGVNDYLGFNWVNADAILDLIIYEDYNRIIENNLEYGISNPIKDTNGDEKLLFYYPITGYSNTVEGMLCSAIPITRLKELTETINIYNGKSFIINSSGEVLTSDNSYINQKFLNTKEIIIKLNSSNDGYFETENVNGESIIVLIDFIEGSYDWTLCTVIEETQLIENVYFIRYSLYFIYILLIATAFISARILSKNISKPIESLQNNMLEVENGNLEAFYKDKSILEIDNLGSSYNSMLDKINSLIKENKIKERKQHEAELSVLQSQINPHFLYNTLDNIKWLAVKENNKTVAKMISNLSTFFRVILSGGQDNIPLKTEIKHTISYLEIQKTRYPNLFDFSYDIEDDIKDLIVPKILIQPIVENSIYHGLKNKDGFGNISIDAKKSGDFIEITVCDNGIGMNNEKLLELRDYIQNGESISHYGLNNIKQRLFYTYGEEAKITVFSKENEGVITTIFIPYKKG